MNSSDYVKETEAIHCKVEQFYCEFKAFQKSLKESDDATAHLLPSNELYQLAVKFVHLVYSFDPNLPLNREIEDVPKKCKDHIPVSGILDRSVLDDFIFYLDFFHSYLSEKYRKHQSPD